MTGLTADDTRLLVLFGEMRGDLKSVLRQQEDMGKRLAAYEDAVTKEIDALDARVGKLEGIKLRVAGFATALGAGAALLGTKAGPFITELASTIGG